MQRPTTPTKDAQDIYQGSPAIGSPGRHVASHSEDEANDKPVTYLKFTEINMNSLKKVPGKLAVKGTVEKTASLGTIAGMPSKAVKFFAVNICDEVSDNYLIKVIH